MCLKALKVFVWAYLHKVSFSHVVRGVFVYGFVKGRGLAMWEKLSARSKRSAKL